MKIFNTMQIRELDDLTIRNEPVSSADLMERAADQLMRWYMLKFDRSNRLLIFCGPGNNGGDGLALARLLSANRYNAEVFFVSISDRTSDDWDHNFRRLEKETSVRFNNIGNIENFPYYGSDDVIIDAIFGSGLTRPAEGLAKQVIDKINKSDSIVVSVDIPSGLFGEDNSSNNPDGIIRADYTLSFQFPKLSFMFPENSGYTGEWHILPIGIDSNAIRETEAPYDFVETGYVASLLKKRDKFDHKGKFGHGLLVAGSFGKTGAAVLGARAALRTGIGLITCHLPGCGYQIIQTSVPESMASVDANEFISTRIVSTDLFDAVGIGPGIGTDPATQKAFHDLISVKPKPLVIDADGLNILGLNRDWLELLPPRTILTPHVREFERIAGKTGNSYLQMKRQSEFAANYNCIVVLKGAHTSIATPQGKIYFNSTGNPGMATGGSGDVLTGMILALLSRGYSAEEAAVIGVFLHGLAGDIAAAKSGQESLIASDIIENTGNAFIKINNGN